MKKKLILLYSALFTIFFITSFLINTFYKNYIKEYEPNHKYNVSGLQYYNFKNKLSKKILDLYFLEKDIEFVIKSRKIEDDSLTFDTERSKIYFELYLSDYIEEKELENGINDIYLGSINSIINDLENSKQLYDFELINEQYKKERENDTANAYIALTNSEFFKKYQPKISCTLKDKAVCYNYFSETYSLIYSFISQNFDEGIFSILVPDDRIKKEEVSSILYDFNNNKHLFEKKDYTNNTQEYDSFTNDRYRKFYSKKYNKFLNSEIYLKYLSSFFCEGEARNCLINVSNYVNLLLFKNKREVKNSFKVEYVPKTKSSNNLSEIIINLAISILFIHFLFKYTNKFFIKKLR